MYTSSELQWLQRLIYWSQNHERYISALKQQSGNDSDKAKGLQEWLDQFIQVRETAESMLDGSYQQNLSANLIDIHQIQQVSQDLNDRFQSFLTSQSERSEQGERRPIPVGGHTLPPLPYDYSALEPYISEKIMRLHHDGHHKSYVDGLNKAEIEMQKARKTGDFSLIKHWEREAVFNGAGHYLHTIFWNNMKPRGGGKPNGPIAKEINQTFGGFETFKEHFSNAAEKVEAVGWALLVWAPRAGRTEILQAEKHQNLSQQDVIPLLVLDVWEHAYYLQYYNKRRDYINAWWHVVNWDNVNERLIEAKKVKSELF
ncbi:Fe-Mn family superoxide dismutase [Scopulibacillus daqui]|uniref:superoxide dismutase n=1 Tax=Scopulibacillus daqui TaxID=1469162 RepID=A0ABS2Q064_9BACL|nr:superoxide dismutase [Scopulibacillus daqui]MBM7645079.1 Fe-Mn family superoxide dismutase [Scopulibacillus daqui]